MPSIPGWKCDDFGRWTWGNYRIERDRGRWSLRLPDGTRQYFDRATDAAATAEARERQLNAAMHQRAKTEAAKRSAAAKKAWATRRAKVSQVPPEPEYRPGQRYRSIDDE